MSSQRTRISKKLSYYLRHHPDKLDFELDREGFSSITVLQLAARMGIGSELIEDLVDADLKGRFEIRDNRIRARFGHTVVAGKEMWEMEQVAAAEDLPDLLYHGTRADRVPKIMREGLLSGQRQFVHLSPTIHWARVVGERYTSRPTILRVRVPEARAGGVRFWIASHSTVLADHVPSLHISEMTESDGAD